MNYSSNSIKSREAKAAKTAEQSAPPERRVEKVANASVKQKSDFKKFSEEFIIEHLTKAKQYAIQDIIIPACKEAMASIFSILIYGEAGRIGAPARGGSTIRRSYDRDYDRNRNNRAQARPKNAFENEDIIFATYGEAEYVLEELRAAIRTYEFARVLDLYDACELTPPATGANFGWANLDNVKPARLLDGSGYYLPMPRPMAID